MKSPLKFYLLSFGFVFLVSSNAISQWIQQGLGYETAGIGTRQIIVVNQDIVWGYGLDYFSGIDVQTFSRSLNGGVNWQLGEIPGYPGYRILNMSAVNADYAWMVLQNVSTTNLVLVRTADGGQTWQELNNTFYPGLTLNKIYFWDENKGFASSYGNSQNVIRFYNTNDGGNTWHYADSSSVLNQIGMGEKILGHISVHDSIVKCITTRGRLLTSYNWGKHWESSFTPFTFSSSPLYSITFHENIQHGLLFGNFDDLYESFDGGITWTEVLTTGLTSVSQIAWIPGTLNTCIRISAYTGYEGCSYSTDGGHNWTEFPQLQGKLLTATGWYDNHTGWVAEITYDPQPSATGIFMFDSTFVEIPEMDTEQIFLSVYPNPMKDVLQISITGGLGMNAEVEVYNLLGEKIATVFSGELSAGKQNVNWKNTGLDSGLYFIKATVGQRNKTIAVVVE